MFKYNFNKLLAYLVLTLAIATIIFPQIDLTITSLFYDLEHNFFLDQQPFFDYLFQIIPIVTKLLTIVICIGFLLSFMFRDVRAIRFKLLYLLLAVIIGPGILVNYIFKDNFGRARPHQITEFGGNKEYTRPFMISTQCQKNCSFTSGHAAMAFYLTSFAYISAARYRMLIYIVAVVFGCFVGLARIVQGGHFFSDVLFSCMFILIINHYLYIYLRKLQINHHTIAAV